MLPVYTSLRSCFKKSRRWIPLLELAGILAAGFWMRVDRLGGKSYWFDEGFVWKMISFSWGEMFARVALDNHGPLYYALLKAWAAASGDSPWALRFFSVAMGELTADPPLGRTVFTVEVIIAS